MSSPEAQGFEDIDWTEKFIQLVQSNPPIYNTNLPANSDRTLISRLRNEIYEAMVPNWNELSSKEKKVKGNDLQGKWGNLKTCFRRELSKHKKLVSGEPARKRRKYVYFDQLLFLLPTMENRPTVSECSPQEIDPETENVSEVIRETEESQSSQMLNNTQASTQQSIKKVTRNQSQTKAKKGPTYEESLLSILRQKSVNEEVIDEDKSFLLSLIPSFKKLSDVHKLEAKMEFLSTLKRLTCQTLFNQPVGGNTAYGRSDSYQLQGYAANSNRLFSTGIYMPHNLSHTTSSTPMPIDSSQCCNSMDPVSPIDCFH